jgi:hypothetical protein
VVRGCLGQGHRAVRGGAGGGERAGALRLPAFTPKDEG